MDLTLHGSASDARYAWGIDNSEDRRVDILWPMGYVAQFTPELIVLDAAGRVVGHEGDLIIGRCLPLQREQIDPSDDEFIRVRANEIRPPNWDSGED